MFSFLVTLNRFFRGIVHSLKEAEFRPLFVFVIIILISGTVFYSSVENWSMFNAFYFSVVTLMTVGYGDYTPHTDAGKLFTIVYLFVGVGTLLAFVNIVAKKSFESSALYRKNHRHLLPRRKKKSSE